MTKARAGSCRAERRRNIMVNSLMGVLHQIEVKHFKKTAKSRLPGFDLSTERCFGSMMLLLPFHQQEEQVSLLYVDDAHKDDC
jgi:hypothetical protein